MLDEAYKTTIVYDYHERLKELAKLVGIKDPRIPNYENYPGSTDKHHGYDYGLLSHTVEVAEYAVHTALAMKVDARVCYIAALWHDYAKKWDYAKIEMPKADEPVWQKTEHCALQRHLSRSYHEYLNYSVSLTNPEYMGMTEPERIKFVDNVAHCILSHHGRREWGSPIEPVTREAYIVSQADLYSAMVGETAFSNPFV